MPRVRLRLVPWLAITASLLAPQASAAQAPAEGWVVLPVDEYNALRDRTVPRPQPPPGVVSTLSRIDYELRPEGDAIAGRARVTLDVLRDGWTRVQIPGGLIVRAATLDGRPAAIVKSPAPHVLIDRQGRFVLDLDVVLPLTRNAGAESIALPASASPVSRVDLALPRGDVDLSAGGGFVAGRVEEPDESRWTVFGAPHQALTLSWKRRIDDRRLEAPLRARAHITHVVGLAEDVSQVAASVRIDVVQGTLDEAVLTVPAGVAVNRVDGATVGGWTLTEGRLVVRLLDPVTTSAAFVVLGDTTAARDGTIALPLVRMPAAERETGGVAVDIVGSGELAVRAARGLDGADPADLGDIVSGRESPSMLAFRMRPLAGSEPRSLAVDVVRYTPQAVLVATIDQARYRMLAAEDGRLLVEATYAVRNNQRSFIKMTLPAGARVWSATVAGRPTRPGAAEAGSLLLPLEKSRAGDEAPVFRVRVVYLQEEAAWPDKGRIRIPLPAVDLPVSTLGVRVHHSPRFRVEPEPGSFREAPDPGLFAEGARPAPAALGTPSPSGVVFDALIDQFRSEGGLRTVTGTLPVPVDFPELGPSLFVAAELAAEGAAPVLQVNVKRTR